MNKLCIFGAATIFGYIGWALGDWLGFEMFGSFMLSSLASIVGVYVGWKFAQRFE